MRRLTYAYAQVSKRPIIWQKRPIIRTKETYRYTGYLTYDPCQRRRTSMENKWKKKPTNVL